MCGQRSRKLGLSADTPRLPNLPCGNQTRFQLTCQGKGSTQASLALLSPLQASLSPLICNHAYLPTHPTTTSRVGRWKEGRRARASVVVCLYANRHRNSNRRWRKEKRGRRAGSESEGASERRLRLFLFFRATSPPLRFYFVALVSRLS